MNRRSQQIHPLQLGQTVPTKALTIRQPWAWAIAEGFKDVETRSWRTHFRGDVFLHAGKSFDADFAGSPVADLLGGFAYCAEISGRKGKPYPPPKLPRRLRFPNCGEVPSGAIIGVIEIVDCVPSLECYSPWSDGSPGCFCWVIRNVRKLSSPFPITGRLNFWDVSSTVAKKLLRTVV